MSKQKFKIGDRVSIAPKYRSRYNALVGTGVVKVLIKSTITGRLLYRVRFVDKEPLFSFYSYELTKSNDELESMTVVDKLKKDKPIQTVEFRPQDSHISNPLESKEPITFHQDMLPGHTVIHEGGAISWVQDWTYDKEKREWCSKKDTQLKTSRDENLEYLQRQWKSLCNTYLEVFCKKHDFPFEPDMWVHDDPGTVVCVSDMYVNMDDLRYDIDHDVPETYFRVWYWKSLELYELCGEKYMNYESYCKGAPDYWTEERIAQIRESKRRIEKAREELEKTIKETAKGKLF